MSDNTMISINWDKNHYLISHHDIENIEIPYTFYKSKTLLGAVKKARLLQNSVFPEYGTQFGILENEEEE